MICKKNYKNHLQGLSGRGTKSARAVGPDYLPGDSSPDNGRYRDRN